MSLVLCRRIESQQPANRKLAAADVRVADLTSKKKKKNLLSETCFITVPKHGLNRR